MLVIQRNSACIQLCTWLCLLLGNYSYGKGDESEFISVDAISDNAVKRSVQRAAVWPAQYGSDSAGAELLVDAGAVYGLSVDSEGNAAQCLHAWNSAVYHRLIGGRAVTSICTGGHYDYHAADCFIKQCMDYGNCGADGVLPALVLTVLLSVLKTDRKSAMLLLLGACFLYPDNTEDMIYLLLCMSGVLLVPTNAASLHMSTELQNEQEYRLSQTSMLKRQMQNYANIFQSLSEYYAQISDVQAELLANMSNALQYNADAIRKIDGYEKDTVRVAKALEGYQYDVRELSIEEPKEGCIQVCVEIANIKRGEIRSTLLPLLEVLLHRNLQIADIRNRKFMRGYHSITVCDDIPFVIDAYADSVKNSYTSSGDTFSIFKFRQSLVCMISDGMGNGERAAQSSRLITNIFQRMMVSGIPQDSAIKCINKLIQSDTYATLDVICFNRSQGVAYISKSAACPTFLLRNDQIYEINGSALPVGIISQMQPDCFQVDLKAGDEYLMISDGIYMNEIYKWLNQRTQTSVKEDVESFTELLKKTRRKDDSTIVLVKVDEV